MTVLHTKRLPATVDFASCTFDQQNRLLKYEVWRELGLDNFNAGTPWTPPVQMTLQVRADSVDAATWVVLKSVKCGQRVTVDSTLSFEWAGEYEVIERRLFPTMGDQAGVSSGSATLAHAASQDAGQIELLLRTYSEVPMTDESDTPTFATVPGTVWWFD